MEQLEFFDIPSPCIGVFRANNKGYCIGCLRSREERLYWLQMSDTQKQQVLRLLRIRRSKIKRAELGSGQDEIQTSDQNSFEF